MNRLLAAILALLALCAVVAVGWWALSADANDAQTTERGAGTNDSPDTDDAHDGAAHFTIIDTTVENRLVVTVVDDRGEPVSAVRVVQRPHRSKDDASGEHRGDLLEAIAQGGSIGNTRPKDMPFDPAARRFVAHHLALGSWRLDVTAPHHEPVEHIVELDGTPAEITITLPRVPSIAGTVVDPSGTPVAQAEVIARVLDDSATSHGPSRRELVVSTRTDEAGRFHLDVPVGTLEISTPSRAGNLGSETRRIEMAPSEQRADLRLSLRAGAIVQGVILDANGAPRARCSVRLSATELAPGEITGAGVRTTTTDAEGRFRFETLAPGTYALAAPPESWTRKGMPSEDAWRGMETIGMDLEVAEGEVRDVVVR